MIPHLQEMISSSSSLVFLALAFTVLGLLGTGTRTNGVEASSRFINKLSNVNKTIREIQRKKEVLKRMEQEVKPKLMPPKRGSGRPWLVNIKGPNPHAHGAGRLVPQPLPQSPISLRSRLDLKTGMKNIIKPSRIERNMLSFPINNEVINGSGKLVSGLKLYVYVWKREPKKKVIATSPSHQPSNLVSTRALPAQNRRRKQRRNKTIKIRVFMSNENGVKGKRIAELKKKISHSKFQPIPLPISLISNIPQSPGNKSGSVHIRVECSRCSRKTRLILPGNDKKRCRKRRKSKARGSGVIANSGDKVKVGSVNKEDNSDISDNKDKIKLRRRLRRRRRRKNCAKTRSLENLTKRPFIVIMDDNIMSRSSRFKRSANSPLVCSTNSGNVIHSDTLSYANSLGQNLTSNSTASTKQESCCKKLETYINFSDLALDTQVISPSGFIFTSCSAVCAKDPKHVRDPHTVQHKNVVKVELSRKINLALSSPSSSKKNSIKNKQNKVLNILKRTRLKSKNGVPSKTRPTDSSPCSPSSTKDLTFLHFNKDSLLVQTTIPDFIVTDCQCKNL